MQRGRDWRRGSGCLQLQLQHFISFHFFAWFRFGFLGLLNGCAARRGAVTEIRNRIKMRQRLRDSSVATRYKCILGSLWLALLGVAHLPVCMSHVSPGEGCIHFIHISFHAPCVNSIQFSLLMCSLCVCVSLYLLLIDMRLFFFFLFAVN